MSCCILTRTSVSQFEGDAKQRYFIRFAFEFCLLLLNQLMVDFHTFSARYLLLGPWLDFDVEVNRPQVEPAILFKLVARVGHLEIHVLQ